MSVAKIAISIDQQVLKKLDALVDQIHFHNRSQLIQEAIKEKLHELDHHALARECAKLDPENEKRLADEGLQKDIESWPEF